MRIELQINIKFSKVRIKQRWKKKFIKIILMYSKKKSWKGEVQKLTE